MTWFLKPDSWKVLINWNSIFDDNNLKSKIWYLPETNPLYWDMWVDEFLSLTAELKWLDNPKREVERVIDLVWLHWKKNLFISTLSKWYKQRVWLVSALIWNPDIIILDEPTEWLDPAQRDEIKKLIVSLWKDKTIIISSHVLTEISSIINRVFIISDWKIKLDEKSENLWKMQEWRMKLHICYEWRFSSTVLWNQFSGIEIEESEQNGLKKIEILTKNDIRKDLYNFLKTKKINIFEFYSEKYNLEDVFFDITKW